MKISKKYLSEVIKHLIFESTELRPYQDIMQEFLDSQGPEITEKLVRLAAYSPVQSNSLANMLEYSGNEFTTDLVFYANKDFEGLLTLIYQLEGKDITYDSYNLYIEELEGVADEVVLGEYDSYMISENISSFFKNAGAPIETNAAYMLLLVCAIDISRSLTLESKPADSIKEGLEEMFGKKIISKLEFRR